MAFTFVMKCLGETCLGTFETNGKNAFQEQGCCAFGIAAYCNTATS